ncbi:hypothetical protein H632_c2981p0, partial [Helicosporidium sp. ATCC 50920]
PEEVARLRRYGRALGLAFQIVDDVLDGTGTSTELGKTAGKDLASRKSTYPALLGSQASMRLVDGLVDEAARQLQGFAPDAAAPLQALALFVRARRS